MDLKEYEYEEKVKLWSCWFGFCMMVCFTILTVKFLVWAAGWEAVAFVSFCAIGCWVGILPGMVVLVISDMKPNVQNIYCISFAVAGILPLISIILKGILDSLHKKENCTQKSPRQ